MNRTIGSEATARRAAATAKMPNEGQALAAIDVGSNAIRLQIVTVRPSGTVVELESLREPVRLGHRVFLTGILEGPEMDRAVSILAAFRSTMDRHRVVNYRAVATSAVREAQNRDLFVNRVANTTKLDLEVISGAEEARLLAVAVGRRVPLERRSALLVDVGGGSVEMAAIQRGRTLLSQSHRLGAVRLYELFCEGSRTSEEKARLVEEYLDRMLKDSLRDIRKIRPELLFAIGGNAETLARISGRRVAGRNEEEFGMFVSDNELNEVTDRLLALTASERSRKYDLRPDRVDTIVPAATLLNFLVKRLGLSGFASPRVGLRDAILAELIDRAAGRFDAREAERTVLSESERLGEHYKYDAAHAVKVREVAYSIFDALRSEQRPSARERVLLGVAATLHDIGEFVGYAHHHKHGYYLVSNSEIGGLTAEEMHQIAVAVRFHRRAHPSDRHPEFAALSRDERKRVSRIAAILRVADSLDREHRQKATKIIVGIRKGALAIQVRALGDFALERWALENKGALFKEVFGMDVELLCDEIVAKEAAPRTAAERGPAARLVKGRSR
jgi:exopolyphosphatase/guanosine-5'-triphosphate,3'-diphosphate pyrophosphatase